MARGRGSRTSSKNIGFKYGDSNDTDYSIKSFASGSGLILNEISHFSLVQFSSLGVNLNGLLQLLKLTDHSILHASFTEFGTSAHAACLIGSVIRDVNLKRRI